MVKLVRLTLDAERSILRLLWSDKSVSMLELEHYVLHSINMTEKLDGTVKHVTKLVHKIAFIKAYKRLEAEGKIEIKRERTPFPMTDFETVFTLKQAVYVGNLQLDFSETVKSSKGLSSVTTVQKYRGDSSIVG